MCPINLLQMLHCVSPLPPDTYPAKCQNITLHLLLIDQGHFLRKFLSDKEGYA